MCSIPLIQVHDGRLSYYVQKLEHNVLGCEQKGFDFSLNEGEHTAIIGRNGSGKSTFLRLLNGQAWLKLGEILWNTEKGYEKYALSGMAMTALISCAQQEKYARQSWNITGEELLLTGLTRSSLLYTVIEEEQKDKLHAFAQSMGIAHLMNKLLPTFSQGQLRILLLARALVSSPKVLLLDEYMDGLDKKNREEVQNLLEKISSQTTCIFATHRLESIPSFVSRYLYLEKGFLTEEMPQEYNTYFNKHKKLVSDESTIKKLVMHTSDSAIATIPPFFDVQNATVFIDSKEVLHNIHWQWKKGEHWQIYGENGSGKSTFLRLLAGDEYPAFGGTVQRYFPQSNGFVQSLAQIRKAVHLVSDLLQVRYSYSLNARELVLSGFDNSIGIYRSFTKEEHDEALYWIRYMQMEKFVSHSIRTLSTGQLRRLFIARALVGKPEILLLDEPYSGLDVFARTHITDLLEKLQEDNFHMLIVSHYDEDTRICNKKAHMNNGYLSIVTDTK